MTTTALRRLASGAMLMLATTLVCACTTHPARPIATGDLEQARSFRLFTVYWVGRSFDGVPLTAADTQRDYAAAAGERVYYGNCDKQASLLSTAGCQLPLEIATVEFRMINSRQNEGLGTRTNTTIRNVPAVVFNRGRSIQLYTAALAIEIYADSARRAMAAAESVVPMNRVHDLDPTVLNPPQFAKGVDPQLLQIERQISLARTAAARARLAAGHARQVAAGSTRPTGATDRTGASPKTGPTGATGKTRLPPRP